MIKYFFRALLVVAALSMSVAPAMAQSWFTGTIIQTGTYDGVGSWVGVTATDGSFADIRAFVIPTASLNQLMAVALTAQSSSKPVMLNVSGLNSWSTCNALFMVN